MKAIILEPPEPYEPFFSKWWDENLQPLIDGSSTKEMEIV